MLLLFFSRRSFRCVDGWGRGCCCFCFCRYKGRFIRQKWTFILVATETAPSHRTGRSGRTLIMVAMGTVTLSPLITTVATLLSLITTVATLSPLMTTVARLSPLMTKLSLWWQQSLSLTLWQRCHSLRQHLSPQHPVASYHYYFPLWQSVSIITTLSPCMTTLAFHHYCCPLWESVSIITKHCHVTLHDNTCLPSVQLPFIGISLHHDITVTLHLDTCLKSLLLPFVAISLHHNITVTLHDNTCLTSLLLPFVAISHPTSLSPYITVTIHDDTCLKLLLLPFVANRRNHNITKIVALHDNTCFPSLLLPFGRFWLPGVYGPSLFLHRPGIQSLFCYY